MCNDTGAEEAGRPASVDIFVEGHDRLIKSLHKDDIVILKGIRCDTKRLTDSTEGFSVRGNWLVIRKDDKASSVPLPVTDPRAQELSKNLRALYTSEESGEETEQREVDELLNNLNHGTQDGPASSNLFPDSAEFNARIAVPGLADSQPVASNQPGTSQQQQPQKEPSSSLGSESSAEVPMNVSPKRRRGHRPSSPTKKTDKDEFVASTSDEGGREGRRRKRRMIADQSVIAMQVTTKMSSGGDASRVSKRTVCEDDESFYPEPGQRRLTPATDKVALKVQCQNNSKENVPKVVVRRLSREVLAKYSRRPIRSSPVVKTSSLKAPQTDCPSRNTRSRTKSVSPNPKRTPLSSHNSSREIGSYVEEDLDEALSSILEESSSKKRSSKISADVIPTKEQGSGLKKVSLSDLIEETAVRWGVPNDS